MAFIAPIAEAVARRNEHVEAWHSENTDCYRLFHGAVEGRPGLAIDRYGPIALAQTWRDPLSEIEFTELNAWAEALGLTLVWNDRARRGDVRYPHEVVLPDAVVGKELGLSFQVTPRHDGIDPLLFLDFRAARRWVRHNAEGKMVLNLFSYTCGIGVAAAAGQAEQVLNVDFAKRNLEVGRANAALNGIGKKRFKVLCEDALCILRQFSGLGVKGRAAKRRFTRRPPQQFDLVVLDPPRLAKSPFGKVDVVGDYQSMLKPALLCAKVGGQLLATNNVASVDEDQWLNEVSRCAAKAGRPVRDVHWLRPEADFPSPDGKPPLKMVVLSL